MVSTLLQEIKSGLRITEAKRHHNNLYTVHGSKADENFKAKTFPSVGYPLLEEALQSAGQLDDFGRIIFTFPLQMALDHGFAVKEFHYFESANDYSCTLSKDDCIDIWLPCVAEKDLAYALHVTVEVLSTSHPLHLKFEDMLKQQDLSAKVVAFDRHKQNNRYTCTILLQNPPRFKTFANITSAHLLDALEKSYPNYDGVRLFIQNDYWVSPEKAALDALMKHKPKGITFEHAMKEFGGKILSKHATQVPGRYSVKVATMGKLTLL
jgi:hypothetical protein